MKLLAEQHYPKIKSRVGRAFAECLTLRALCFTLGIAAPLLPRDASAIPFYFEFGGGAASAAKTDPLLSSAPGKLQSGFAGEMTLGVNLQEHQSGILFQLGVQQRYLGGTTVDGDAQILPTYGLFRVEIWRLILGVGYSMHVWKDLSFQKHPGASAVLGEATFLFPITPEIDFAIQGATQSFTSGNGVQGPDRTYEGLALFRLNFGLSKSATSERRKYKGWRYPFGVPMN